MLPYRSLSKLPITAAKRVIKPTITRKMSLFPRAFVGSDPSFTPLFRLLDDFDTYTRSSGSNGHHRSHMKTFSPKFDVKELSNAYELHGELPGIDQKDVEIEFTDSQTLTVRGRVERSYTSGIPPSNLVEGTKSSGAITEGGERTNSHKATVEDENEANKTSTSVATQDQKPEQQQQQEQAKYWVSERSFGEFARSFSFPARVDQGGVKASMNNGILSILVPKAKKHESRKIQIS
jgi:HSP20 family protein